MKTKLELKPGDLIWANRSVKYGPYNHCGIYENAGYVIHFAPLEGEEINSENAIVHRTTFEKFKDGCPVILVVIDPQHCLDVKETLRRAKEGIGTRGYNIATFNCDHFATRCKTGVYCSIQCNQIKEKLPNIFSKFHGMIEKFKSGNLGKKARKKDDESLQVNSIMGETIQLSSYENIIEMEKFKSASLDKNARDEVDALLQVNSIMGETIQPYLEENQSDTELVSLPSTVWYENVAERLKKLTYPIAGALEVAKRLNMLPSPLKLVDFQFLGAKVRNVMDGVVSIINATTDTETGEERDNNEAALLGNIVTSPLSSVSEAVKVMFGKTGSYVNHEIQEVITRIVPESTINIIIKRTQEIGDILLNRIKDFLPVILPVILTVTPLPINFLVLLWRTRKLRTRKKDFK